jgi:hypothetical protein
VFEEPGPSWRIDPLIAEIPMTRRRDFLAKISLGAAALAFDPEELRAELRPGSAGPWDTSWIPKVEAAPFRAIFNASEISDGASLDYAATFLDHFHEAHGTTDAQTRPVIIARRLGTALGLNDAMWDKYALGADTKTTDPATRGVARRNVYWTSQGGDDRPAIKIDALQRRGMIMLVCSVALGNMGSGLAEDRKRDVEEVRAELRGNLVPGAILVPSGIYALIRAQNAGCAYMQGT